MRGEGGFFGGKYRDSVLFYLRSLSFEIHVEVVEIFLARGVCGRQ